jgi:hypothetical protein
MATVFSAHSRLRSTQRTLHPSLARRIAIARPFPIPSPWHPAPVTMAVLPCREREGGVVGMSAMLLFCFPLPLFFCCIVRFVMEGLKGRIGEIGSCADYCCTRCGVYMVTSLWTEDVGVYLKLENGFQSAPDFILRLSFFTSNRQPSRVN